jgi:hypothetical protein
MPSYGHYVSDYLIEDFNKQKMLRGNCNEFWNYVLYNTKDIKEDMKHQQSLHCKFSTFYYIFKKWNLVYGFSLFLLVLINIVLLLSIQKSNNVVTITGNTYKALYSILEYVYVISLLIGILSRWVYHSRILLLSKIHQSETRCKKLLKVISQSEFIIDTLSIIFIALGIIKYYIFFTLLLLLSVARWNVTKRYLLALRGVAILIMQTIALILILSVISAFLYFYASKCTSFLECGSPFIFKVFMWFTGAFQTIRPGMEENAYTLIIANVYSIITFIITARLLYGSIYSQVHLTQLDEKENTEYCIVCGTNRKNCDEMWEVHTKKHQLIQYVLLFLVLNEKDYEMTSIDAYLLREIRHNSTKFLPFNKGLV